MHAVAFLAVAAACLAVGSAGAPADLTIRIYDAVPLPASAADAMRATAEAALAPAGIRLRWLSCPGQSADCGAPRTARDVVVRLLHEHSEGATSRCGFAVSSEGRGFISLQRACATRTAEALERRPLRGPVSPLTEAEILGYTLAHEIAHVLLPGVPHSGDGIFKAQLWRRDWDRLSRRAPAFNPADIRRLRAAVARVDIEPRVAAAESTNHLYR